MLKFLVDESSGNKLAAALIKEGHDALYAGEVLRGESDGSVLAKSLKENRILITNDKDFGELIFRQRKECAGIIFLRLKKDTPRRRIDYALSLIEEQGKKLSKAFVTISETSIRIRELK
ncbi:DUF5615 family PIN-like protein [Candidatus Woesearchaeota archaeon]|nr:DUF5615 family PIN-like protein [Candidatus Woesearchaeota archaeon]